LTALLLIYRSFIAHKSHHQQALFSYYGDGTSVK